MSKNCCTAFLSILYIIVCQSSSSDTQSQDTFQDSTSIFPVNKVLPLGSIQADVWLKHQIQVMIAGSTGQLEEIHEKIKKDNGWLGGQEDGWEETPYSLDGAMPSTYLFHDADLKAKTIKYIDWVLAINNPLVISILSQSRSEKEGMRFSSLSRNPLLI